MSKHVFAPIGRLSRDTQYIAAGVLAVVAWGALYAALQPFSTWATALLPLAPGGRLASAAEFFIFETPKVLLLLAIIVYAMGVIRSFFSPERTRAFLAGKREGVGNIAAAALGIVTPFCSCSAVPLFLGFVTAGVPLGVSFSFLITAPMVNEIALGLLFALFGWKVALIYLCFGLAIGIVAGMVIGRMRLEGWLEEWVQNLRASPPELPDLGVSPADRIVAGLDAVKQIVGKTWIYIALGIAAGAFIHGYVPQGLMASVMGRGAWWSVPAAVLLGIPMYSNAAGIIPIAEALLAKGAAMGTVLAFMMSVTALSLPEFVILRKVLTPRLIAVFAGVVGFGIIVTGFLFNLLF
jgi:hypothetical protein